MQQDDWVERDIQNPPQAPGLCHSIGFLEPLWGQIMRNLVWLTKRVRAGDWSDIMKGCVPHLRLLSCAREECFQSEEGHFDRHRQRFGLHVSIQMNWWVQH